ncbi:hypothetical protein [Nostoc sp. NOS(2021)]|uniref:hypothetical protein n=1 Tax=Nostoc sp. NOS(2021) TaxID=2815407 RepID=UPI0025E7E36F|nr:hypothetical protein [Nostoc sp. NOS(2021)]
MEPVDFAEVLAQIDVETERLGWTMEQRREHLKKNYGKRSRTLLTEVELLDFLQYLASQPSPPLDEVLIAGDVIPFTPGNYSPQEDVVALTGTGRRKKKTQPADLSDVIAKTNVELQRLGWTLEQGREHLIKTYGKRGRTLLTQVELLDYFQYLASQPIPPLDEVLIAKINVEKILIPKINVELQRLGWTTEQGREHLKKNYGKCERPFLTEVELLDFFQYIASQPTPTLDEILIAKINVEIERLWWTQEDEQEYVITTFSKQNTNLLTQEELLGFLKYLESQPTLEYPSELDAEYEEFQDFCRYSEESDNIITRISSEDLSKVLAKTDIEMERLGLTVEWGREHLIKTYGKRGRTLLTDEELHEFLQYLQSQPDPLAGF